LAQLRELTHRPVMGVLPWSDKLWLDAEDSLSYVADGVIGRPAPPIGAQWLRVAVIRLPRISNATDTEALGSEPGVAARFVTEPSRIADADLVVIPGSKATVSDLQWLRETGLAQAITEHAAQGKPILGICGGFQMLAMEIDDEVESGTGAVAGLGLLDVDISFAAKKTVARVNGTAAGEPVHGYEIHHGQVTRQGPGEPLLELADGTPEGLRHNTISGTHWHGLLENNAYRRRFLAWAAETAGRTGFTPATDTDFEALRQSQLDLLGDLVANHMDTGFLLRLLEKGSTNAPGIAPGIDYLP
jgi:adenosylcobyric acid synthase